MFVKLVPVVTAKDMFDAVTSVSDEMDAVIKAAAVADYRPREGFVNTEEDQEERWNMSIELERTTIFLKWLGEHRKDSQFLCGFSMETENMLENSRGKIKEKKVDMIVCQQSEGCCAGFGTDTNVVTIITKDGAEELPIMSRKRLHERSYFSRS